MIIMKLSTAALTLAALSGAAASGRNLDTTTSNNRRRLKGDKMYTNSPSKTGKFGKSCKANPGDSTTRFSTVYTMTNQPTNEIVIYERNERTGELAYIKNVATGGAGFVFETPNGVNAVDDPLASTGSLIVAGEGKQSCLLAVNAGSNTVSSFKIGSAADQLALVSEEGSGGLYPVSITERDGLVYVLNAGGKGSIVGFSLIGFTCQLTALGQGPTELTRPGYNSPAPPYLITETPAQIGFTPKNEILVTIKQVSGGPPDFDVSASLNLYEVSSSDGTIVALTQTNLDTLTRTQTGDLAFSFTFDSSGNVLLVEPALDGQLTNGVVSVIENVDSSGNSVTITSEATTESTASCWIQYNPKSSCVYTTNNGGNNMSSFSLNDEGELKRVSNEAGALNAPIDMIQSNDYNFLYALSTGHTDAGQPSIHVYEMTCGCELKPVQIIEDGLDTEDVRRAADGTVNGYVGLALYSSY